MSETQGKNQQLTLEAARAKLAGQTGKKYWRSVDELADTPAFRDMVQREFPSQAAEWLDPTSRRGFLKVMGASLALAGLSGCTKQPDELIYPYIKQPEDLVLGRPMYFATAMPFNTGAVPLLVKTERDRKRLLMKQAFESIVRLAVRYASEISLEEAADLEMMLAVERKGGDS